MATVTVRVNPRDFARGVKYAKAFGGRFDGATKLWTIPADRPELGALASYGLIRAEAPAPAPVPAPAATATEAAPARKPTLADAVERPQVLTDAQVFEAHALFSARLWSYRVEADKARRGRPSYAPRGRETAWERGTSASVVLAERHVAAVEAEAVRRGLWS